MASTTSDDVVDESDRTHLFDIAISHTVVEIKETREQRIQYHVEGPDGQTAIADDPMWAIMEVVDPLLPASRE